MGFGDKIKDGGIKDVFGISPNFQLQYNGHDGVVDNSFKFTIDTTKTGTPSTQFQLPLIGVGYNATVDWGDDSEDVITTFNQAETLHTYSSSGTYQISITGDFPRIFFNNTGDKLKLSSIDQWGTIEWGSMNFAFGGCSNMVGNYTDIPDTSLVLDFFAMFAFCSSFNSTITGMDVSSATTLSSIFYQCTSLNSEISLSGNNSFITTNMFFGCTNFNSSVDIDLSLATGVSGMFDGCSSFNQNIGSFSLGSVTDFSYMLRNCTAFNNGGSNTIKDWDTSSGVNFLATLESCSVFNQPISWNTGLATNMTNLFRLCAIFNQPLSLDTSNVTSMNEMFVWCLAFDQDISGFNISSLTSAASMFANVTLSTANYDALLVGWEGQAHNNSVNFHAGSSKYSIGSAADTAKTVLTGTDLWSITDGGGV